jgi:hypothetical protein
MTVSQRCPNCGRDLPPELGQHSVALVSGLAKCPHCGADVHIDKAAERESTQSAAGEERGSPSSPDFDPPSTRSEASSGDDSSETFSGEETMSGVVEEARRKQDG